MPDDDDLDLSDIFDEGPSEPTSGTEDDIFSDLDGEDDMDLSSLVFEGNDINLAKPWMRFHQFHLVTTVAEVKQLVDACLQEGHCALDLETEGFDNRIEYTEDGKPYTRHKIVGYCIGLKGAGYYIPVRHRWEALYGDNPNVDDIDATEAEIARLCQASQPELTEDAKTYDPLSSKDWVRPPQVVIEFWHCKFDQEFLYPVTGIDWWHPESFEDAMLANYVLYTDDDHGLKENAFRKIPLVQDPNDKTVSYPYEMITFKDLFPSGMKKNDMRFYNLKPTKGSNGWNAVLYGCSDGICTNLLCGPLVKAVHDQKMVSTYRLEKQVAQAVRILERARILIDKEEILNLLKEAEQELQYYEEKIIKLAEANGFHGFNPGSSQQLSEFLFGERGLNLNPKPAKTDEGQYKTDEKTLEAFAEESPNAPEILFWVIKRRQIDKIRGTYLQNLSTNTDELNQLRLNFKQTGAATGRFTAPNGDPEHGYGGVPIQGIPARSDPKKPKVVHSLRRVFIARERYVLVKVDYASQELRIASNVSGEKKWIAEYEKEAETGEAADLHYLTAAAFFPGLKKSDPDFKLKRNSGKTANFALVYGGGVGAVQRATGCDKIEGARLKKAFDESVPQFSKWVKRQHKIVKEHKGVKTAFGRFIAIPDAAITPDEVNAALVSRGKAELPRNEAFKQSKKIQASCERKSTNYPIQGCLKHTSLVQTTEGQKAIGELASRGEPFEVWVGDQWAPAIAKDMGPCELSEVSLKDGTTIECDTRHKLLVVTDNGYEWIEYSELEAGMPIATSLCEPLEFIDPPPLPEFDARKRSRNHPHIAPSKVEDFWYWIGRYYGDGWLDSRGAIVFCFGDHEQEAIQACCAFWLEAGLNPSVVTGTHTPKNQISVRHRVEVWSVDLYDWLLKIGLQERVTAHTKRFPERIFRESFEHRKSLICGFLDSDGHKPPLVSAKGNPYNLHLCQRLLLVDVKRLLRTLGVESVLRGPYCSGKDIQGKATTSYRLDIQRRMFEKHVLGKPARLPIFQDMFAPEFLIDEFLAKGPFRREAFESNESAYNLYLRLKSGGQVTVYTLKFLCQLLGVELQSPIYGYKRIASKKSLGREEHTYTLSVQHPLHRFESDGVITKNSGADILKISLVMLTKELYLRGWLKNGGDDSVRMVMTVHDEIVFEILEDRVAEALPVIIKIMEYPTYLARPTWKVPLIAEADLGSSWAATISWHDVIKGKIDPPEYLKGKEIQQDPPLLIFAKKPPSTPAKQITLSTAATIPKEPETSESAQKTLPSPPPSEPRDKQSYYALFVLDAYRVTPFTVSTVYKAIGASVAEAAALDKIDELVPLELHDEQGNVLYPAKDGALIYPEEFGRKLREATLSPGSFDLIPFMV